MKFSQSANTAWDKGNGKGSNGSTGLALGAGQGDFCRLVRDATAPIDLTHTVPMPHARTWTVPAGAFAALKPQGTDTFAHAHGATLAVTGTDWMNVATVEFPVFSGRLSIVIC